MRNNTSQCGVVSSDTHTSVRQHIPSAAPATPRPSSPGRVTRPWSFQHPAHTRLPPCCEPWLCGRGTSDSTRPADRPWSRHNGSAHACCHLYTALAHQEGRFSARSVRTRPAKGVGKPQLTSRTPATAPQLFRVLTSNDQETNFSWGSHPSSKLHPQRPHQSADRRSQHTACAAAVGSTPALCGEFERNAAYYTYPGSATGSSALCARVTSMPHNATNATRRAGHNASGRDGVEAPQGAGAGGGRPIDYQRIIKLFVNKHTEGLVDRQVSAIQRLVRKNQEGYVVWRFSQHGGCPLSAAARCLSPVHACWNHVLTASTWFRLPRLQVLHQGPTSHRGAVALGVWSCRSWC